MELQEGFKAMLARLLGAEAPQLMEALSRPPEVSVRLNGRKPGAAFADTGGTEPVPWCPSGLYLPERPVFTLDPLLHAGAYYVQDASSMIHGEAVGRLLARFAAEGHEPGSWPLSLLDMCAAPGGKTTAMVDRLPDNSRGTANEYTPRRVGALRENTVKWGFPVTVTNRPSDWFADRGLEFDIVAVDAPCSGEGMMRKEPQAVAQWSERLVEECAALQKEILANAAKAVRPGGYLIYSTCTFNRRENEENLEYAVNELGMEAVELDFPEEWGIPRGICTALPAWRFMPHRTRGEGLFLGVLRKPGVFEPGAASPVPVHVHVQTRSAKGKESPKRGKAERQPKEECPPMEELLRWDNRDALPRVELTREQALAYLRRESVTLPGDAPRGLVAVTYGGLVLGPAKNIGIRANNLYPKEWRILMRQDKAR